MAKRPTIKGLQLEKCCIDDLKMIDEKKQLSKLLKAALIGSPFFTMLGSNPIGVVFTIVSTDWDNLVKVTKLIDRIKRERCQTIANLHHMYCDKPNAKRIMFWGAMVDSFS